MATGIFDLVGIQSAAATLRVADHRMNHVFHQKEDCEECSKDSSLSRGRERHRARVRRWLERRLGPARYDAVERMFAEEN